MKNAESFGNGAAPAPTSPRNSALGIRARHSAPACLRESGIFDVHYAGDFSSPQPNRRSGNPSDEKRLYFAWTDGKLKSSDESLLRRAGVPTKDRILLQFFPEKLESNLKSLEVAHAGSNIDLRQIRQTVFAVRPTDGGFEFHVVEQHFRTVPGHHLTLD